MPITLERTPVEKQLYAKTLLDAGATIRAVQAKTKLSGETVIAIKRSQDYSSSMLDEFRRRLPYKAYKLADDVLDLIEPNEIKKAPLNIKMMAFGIAIDKARDMEGLNRPQFNIVSVIADCKQTREKLEKQMAAISQARARITSTQGMVDNTQ